MQGESVGITIPRNYFDLTQEHVFTAEAGLIYPVYSTILMPGDVVKVRNECVVRQMPTINPSFSRFKVRFWDFAVAIRNLDKNIYRFLSGYEEYTSEVAWDQPLPKWNPSDINKTRPGSLWDFLENPVNCIPEKKFQQIDYFRQAYGYIWDMYFRNETRQNSILDKGQPGSWKGEDLLRVNYDRDYFTTSLPKQVLGEPMGIPISGTLQAVFNRDIPLTGELMSGGRGIVLTRNINYTSGNVATTLEAKMNETIDPLKTGTEINVEKSSLNDNTIEIKNATSILLSQLTEMLAIESMHLVNAIAGIRDDEFLSAHWGISPSNEALQYPIVFGKSEMSLITETVFQTAPNTNDANGVGDMYGKGTAVGESNTNTYHAKEFCIYIKLMYIKPETIYGGQGISREKCQNTMYDFPFVELNHLAMQPIYAAELLCASSKLPTSDDNGITIKAGTEDNSAEAYNNRILGFATNFSWYTEKRAKVSGLFIQEQYYDTKDANKVKTKDNLYNWTEARFFSIKDGERPIVNNDFLTCKLDNRNYQIIDNTVERSQFMVWHNNIVDSWRSLSSKRLPSMLGITQGLK